MLFLKNWKMVDKFLMLSKFKQKFDKLVVKI